MKLFTDYMVYNIKVNKPKDHFFYQIMAYSYPSLFEYLDLSIVAINKITAYTNLDIEIGVIEIPNILIDKFIYLHLA